MKKFALTDWVRVAMYAALYTALTIVFAPISYYSIQFRISSALLAAVFLDPAAILGLPFGSIIAGLYGGLGIFDFLVIPILSVPIHYVIWRYCKNYWQAVLVATAFNVAVTGPIIFSLLGLPWYLGSFWVSLGDLGVFVILGYPLYKGLRKIYKQNSKDTRGRFKKDKGWRKDMKEGGHQIYKTSSGLEVPSVTTIVAIRDKSSVLVPWANKLGLQGIEVKQYIDEKAEIGSLAHRMILDYFLNEETNLAGYSEEVIEKATNSFISFLKWTKGKEIKPLFIEQSLVSEKELFGGTPDFYGLLDGEKTIIDYNTGSRIYREYLYQLAGYSILLEEAGYEVKQVLIVRIPRSEDEEFSVQYIDTLEKERLIFRHLLAIYYLEKKGRASNEKGYCV